MSASVTVERFEDMSADGRLRVTFQGDGDVIISVIESQESLMRLKGSASVEFCTFAGGGKSKRTIKALRELAKAIWLDNMDEETRRGQICQDLRPWFPEGELAETP